MPQCSAWRSREYSHIDKTCLLHEALSSATKPSGAGLRNSAGISPARGFIVSTVGRDEELIRKYIRNKEQEDARLNQLNLRRDAARPLPI